MKNILFLFLVLPLVVFGQKEGTVKTEKSFKIVPLITSTPLMGWGFGLSSSYLYKGDKSESSKSQLNVGGQYSNTDSYSVFGKNVLWLRGNGIMSSSNIAFSDINNEFDDKVFGDVQYKINSLLIAEILMFKVSKNFYLGTPLSYKRLKYTPNNAEGAEFIKENGIRNENTGGLGIMASFDSRRNKYFPSNSAWVSARINNNPT